MGAIEPKALVLELAQQGHAGAVAMAMQRHPLFTALRGAIEGGRAARQAHYMGLQHPYCIAAAQDRREVVGLVHVLKHHGEIAHAAIEHGLEPLKAAGQQGHGVGLS